MAGSRFMVLGLLRAMAFGVENLVQLKDGRRLTLS